MKSYFKLEMPTMEMSAFIEAIIDSVNERDKSHKIVEGSIKYDSKNDKFIIHIPPEFVGSVSEGVSKAIKNEGITQKIIVSEITYVSGKKE